MSEGWKMGADTEEIYDHVMDGYANQAPPKASRLARTLTVALLSVFAAVIALAFSWWIGVAAHAVWWFFVAGWNII